LKALRVVTVLFLAFISTSVSAQAIYYGAPYQLSDAQIPTGYFDSTGTAVDDWLSRYQANPQVTQYPGVVWCDTVFGSCSLSADEAASVAVITNGCGGCTRGKWIWAYFSSRLSYAYLVERLGGWGYEPDRLRGYNWIYPSYANGVMPFVDEPICTTLSTSPLDPALNGGIAATVSGGCGSRNVFATANNFRPESNLGGGNCSEGTPSNNCGNPINAGTGNKFQTEADFFVSDLLQFVRYYNSSPAAPTHLLGGHWTNFYTRSIESIGPSAAVVHRPDGNAVAFNLLAGAWTPGADVVARLERTVDGATGLVSWLYYERDDRQYELYDQLGRLQALERLDGASVSLTYNHGVIENNANDLLASSVTAQDGRSIQFQYDASRRLIQITDPTGAVYGYGYDASSRLTSVSYPGGTGKTYLYNEPAFTNGTNLPTALTGIVDEKNQRFATYNYGIDGRAISTEHAGGVDKHAMVYGADGTTSITLPAGAVQQRTFVAPNGIKRTSAISETAGAVTRSSSYTFDSNGRTDVVTDAVGTTTDYDFDARGLLVQKTESANKPTTLRRTQTDWNASYGVPTERRRLNATNALMTKETWTYGGRFQMTTATVTDTTTTPNVARTTSVSYCEPSDVTAGSCPRIGLMVSVNGPRTDVSDIVAYRYYMSDDAACASSPTSCPHRAGDLWKTTNALGQASETLRYDGAGRPLSVKDANGIVTDLEYSPRGWLTASKVRGSDPNSEADDAVTRFDYDFAGEVTKATQPDGSFVSFNYDAAHRLTDSYDALGNRLHLVLDSAGNRIQEDSSDSSGTLKRTLSRIYDSLGQLQTLADAAATPTDFTYDLNGNPDKVTDALGRVSDSEVDPLNRLKQVIANTAGGAGDKATTLFGYDARDNLTTVIDPKGLTTNYSYNGFDDLTQLSSPDTGTASYGYDAAGNRTSQLDARGKKTGYGYDALSRLTSQTVPTVAQNVYFDYDVPQADCVSGETFGIGRLSRIRDESGSSRYCYDERGHRVRQVQTVTGGSTLTAGATFNASDRLLAMTYPSGAIVTYLRNGNGQISRIDAKPSVGATQVTLVSSVSYLPFGPLNVLTFGNGRVLTRAFDQNYGIDRVSDSAASNPLSEDFTLNLVGSVTGLTEQTGPSASATRTFSYDGLDRLTGQKNGTVTVEAFAYEATGDRTSKTVGASTTAYSYSAGSHRISSIAGTARSYDSNGNTTLVGTANTGRAFRFDDRNRFRDFLVKNKLKASYCYNGRGERVLKTDAVTAANSRQFVYDEAGHLLGEYTLAGVRVKEYVWLDDTLVAILGSFDASTYQLVETDHLGTPRAVVHPSKNAIIWRWDLNNTAFGEHLPNGNPDGDSLSYSLNLRFPGQYYDAESGLHYNTFRDYDPATGRYIESDPIGLSGGANTYGYVGGRPSNFIDPLGLFGFRDAAGFVPVLGSGLDAYDSFNCGNIGMGLLNTGLALVDLTGLGAVAKGLTVGAFKISARTALNEVYKDGRSMVYRRVRDRMLTRNLVTKNIAIHHWWYKQAGDASDSVLNAPWNLMPDISAEAHYLAHHGNLAEKFAYGTPAWFKASLSGVGSITTGFFTGSGCDCK